jgi:transposase
MVVLARDAKPLAESTRRAYLRRLDHKLNAILALAPTSRDGRRLRKRYGKVPSYLFTFLKHPDAPPDNNGSERELRPTATYRKVTGGFRSHWAADFIRRFAIGHRHCRTLRHRRIPRNSRCSQTGSR